MLYGESWFEKLLVDCLLHVLVILSVVLVHVLVLVMLQIVHGEEESD